MVLILRFTPVINSFGNIVWHWEKASECKSELRVPALTQPQRTYDMENLLPFLTVNLHIYTMKGKDGIKYKNLQV